MHHTKIKSLDYQRENPKRQKVLRIVQEDENPKLEVVRWQTTQARGEADVDQRALRMSKKRPRGEMDEVDPAERSVLEQEDA